LAESYSFIWQPWVLMYSLPSPGRACADQRAGQRAGYRPVWWAERRLASRSWRLIHSGGGKAGNSTRIPAVRRAVRRGAWPRCYPPARRPTGGPRPSGRAYAAASSASICRERSKAVIALIRAM
jgi:hypothetical protein